MGMHTKGDDNLKILAEASGGRAFFPVKLDDVSAAFRDIQEELRSQYSISYRAENLVANGQFRPIQIIADRKKFKVRAKKGYYVAEPQSGLLAANQREKNKLFDFVLIGVSLRPAWSDTTGWPACRC